MWPTLKEGKLVWITFMRADYLYQRGQIVIFQAPMEDDGHRDTDPIYWIKRIVAVADDTKTYVADPDSVDVAPRRVPDGHVWVQGDNRPSSMDSRLLGSLPVWRIVGVVSRHRPDDWKSSL